MSLRVPDPDPLEVCEYCGLPIEEHGQECLALDEALPYDVPLVIGQRGSLIRRWWDAQCSFFAYAEEHRLRDYERETLADLQALPNVLAAEARGETESETTNETHHEIRQR